MALSVPQEVLDEIRTRIDIVSLISEHLPLKKSGKDYKGLCPFHEEKTPSFMVSPVKQIFHCFGCGEGGNIFSFLVKQQKLSFPEAVRQLADRAGVDLSPHEGVAIKRDENKAVLYKINRYAAWFYAQTLSQHDGGKALQYISKRGLDQASVEAFHLGYAPAGWDGLVRFLESKKVPLDQAERLGLIRKGRDGGYYDFFRDRLMFPIQDYEGRVIGFGGRSLSSGSSKGNEAKYINSPESPVYHKSNSIYGLLQAKEAVSKMGKIILVEGYMDLIRLYQAGIRNVGAPLGTAVTLSQVKFLSRYSHEFILMFDGDEAGKKALLRVLPLFFASGLHPRVVRLPDGEDPDTFVGRHGSARIIEEMENSHRAMEWLILHLLVPAGAQTSRRIDAVKGLMPFVMSLTDDLERKGYLTRIAQFLGLGEEALTDLVQRRGRRVEAFVSAHEKSKKSLERILLELYVKDPCLASPHITKAIFNQFDDEGLGRLGLTLYEQFEHDGRVNLEGVVGPESGFDPNMVSELAFEESETLVHEELIQLITDCLMRWKRQKIKKELKQITGEIHLAEIRNDPTVIKELLFRKSEALKSLKGPVQGS